MCESYSVLQISPTDKQTTVTIRASVKIYMFRFSLHVTCEMSTQWNSFHKICVGCLGYYAPTYTNLIFHFRFMVNSC